MHVIEPAREPAPVAIERPAADPGVPRPPIPGDDPVVERESQRRQVLVLRSERGEPLEHGAQVVAEEADEAAQERGRVRRDEDRPIEARDEPPGDRERVGAGGGRFEDRDRVGGEVGPAGVAAGSGALEQDEPGQVAERLRGVDRARFGDPVGQPAEPKRSLGARGSGSSCR